MPQSLKTTRRNRVRSTRFEKPNRRPKRQVMPFKTVRGLKGKVYVPDPALEGTRKHPCKDCYSCQLCSDDRCRVCRNAQSACQCEKLDQH